jgi:hypothetical protein
MTRGGGGTCWIFNALAAMLLAGCATTPAPAPVARPLAQALRDHVDLLSSDAFVGRAPGTVGETLTLNYLEAEWQAMGLVSGTHDPASPWRAPFTIYGPDGEIIVTHNLIGRIEGSDPQTGAVLLLAHWDHLGVNTESCGGKLLDRLCNGAIDNATGLAMITEIARILAAGPRLERDVYVMATSAEERGLLGARAFAADPPVPLSKFVAAFNIDSEGLAPSGSPAVVIGEEGSPLATLVGEVAAEQGVTLIEAEAVNREYMRRQDGWALQQMDLPAVMVSASFADAARLSAWMDGSYHRPDDESEKVELGAAEDMVRLHVALIRAAADPSRYAGAELPPAGAGAANGEESAPTP